MRITLALLTAAACWLPWSALAQWQWIDKDNRRVFSDTAPPADVLEKNILRRPPGVRARPEPAATPAPTPAPASEAATDAAAAPPALPRPSGVDKQLEEKARQAEQAEKARQAAEAQKLAQAKAENCRRARESKATFDSGIRVARVNARGEREILDDAARAAEQKRLQAAIAANCQ